jgi:hypothetical protein
MIKQPVTHEWQTFEVLTVSIAFEIVVLVNDVDAQG